MFFDLFYPFFRAIVKVDEMELQPPTSGRRTHQHTSSQAVGYAHPAGMGAAPYQSSWASSAGAAPIPPPPLLAPYAGGSSQWQVGRPAFGHRGTLASGGSVGFMGKPISQSVVGAALGLPAIGVPSCTHCQGGPTHFSWECPIRYFRKYNQPCPGFDQHGNRQPAAWSGNNITSHTKAAWRTYISQHGLPDAHRAGGRAVDFS
jgi:hypothetical protein